jgi:beta-N-acetylhexosaminidase
MTLQHRIGQCFIIGFDGPAITPEFQRLVGQYKAGNVILFRENLQSAAQAKALCGDIKALIIEETGIPPFVAIAETHTNGGFDCAEFDASAERIIQYKKKYA